MLQKRSSAGIEIDQIPQLKAASLVIGSNYGDRSRGDNGGEETAREIALREERKIVLLHERKVLLQKTQCDCGSIDGLCTVCS